MGINCCSNTNNIASKEINLKDMHSPKSINSKIGNSSDWDNL